MIKNNSLIFHLFAPYKSSDFDHYFPRRNYYIFVLCFVVCDFKINKNVAGTAICSYDVLKAIWRLYDIAKHSIQLSIYF